MRSEKTALFAHAVLYAGQRDIGRRRESNQDEFALCPEAGFFAVTDGMGGLSGGEKASEYVKQSSLELIGAAANEYEHEGDIERVARAFRSTVAMMSDKLYYAGNTGDTFIFGATFSGVWLVGDRAIFVSLGDSRGYMLGKRKRSLEQVTDDQNLAGLFVRQGKLTREEAKNHPSSCRLTAFVGMRPPAEPQMYIEEIRPGDRILLCSDGLYGMSEERDLAATMRSSKSPERVCERLVDRANENGGRDNISAVYIKILA